MGPAKHDLYPLEMSLHHLRKDWGGWPGKIGEIWSLAGPPIESLVLNGPLSGQRLTEVVGHFQQRLLGQDVELDPREPFPFLIKFVSTAKGLPIHVHPDDTYTVKNGLPMVGLEKLWYILQVESGGLVYYGFKKKMSPERVREAIDEGHLHLLMNTLPVKPGELYTVPPGRLHGIGKGVTLLEIQTHSHLTWDAFSWDGKGREKRRSASHLDEVLQILDLSPAAPRAVSRVPIHRKEGILEYLACTSRFLLRKLQIRECIEVSHPGTRFLVYTGLRGSGWLRWGFSEIASYIEPYQSVVVPAVPQDLFLECEKGFEVLETSISDMTREGLREIGSQGVTQARIIGLGGCDYGPLLKECLRGR